MNRTNGENDEKITSLDKARDYENSFHLFLPNVREILSINSEFSSACVSYVSSYESSIYIHTYISFWRKLRKKGIKIEPCNLARNICADLCPLKMEAF